MTQWKVFLPYLIVHRGHHPSFGLPNSDLQPLGLAIAGEVGGSMADSAVRVHSDDRLALFVFPGIHLSGEAPEAVEGDTGV